MPGGDYNTDAGYPRDGGGKGPKGSTHEFGKPILDKNPGAGTTLNACLMAGMVERSGSWSGQGGYHNFIHFIENWKAVGLVYSGSTVCLWSSRLSTGTTSTAFYFPPVRKWAFDPMYRDLDHMPPATPRVVSPRLSTWELARNHGTFPALVMSRRRGKVLQWEWAVA